MKFFVLKDQRSQFLISSIQNSENIMIIESFSIEEIII